MRAVLYFFLATALFAACRSGEHKDQTYKINEMFPNDSLSARDSMRMDSLGLTTIKFEKEVYDFGEVTEGTIVKKTMSYTNSGKHPLVIEQAYGSCGCTIASFSKEPIQPGESGKIDVEFNSTGRVGAHTKSVIVEANTIPPVNYINFSVKVDKK